jgi:AraC-like DNA-binding protein
VQFYPWAPAHFISGGLAETADNFLPMDQLQHRLQLDFDVSDEAAVMRYFQRVFPRLLTHGADAAMQACQLIRQYRGNIPVATVAGEFGKSRRYLETLFRQTLGISPKEYAGIIRIRSLVDLVQRNRDGRRISILALEQGFYDQAHFIRTFRARVNVSPGKFNIDNYLLSQHGSSY